MNSSTGKARKSPRGPRLRRRCSVWTRSAQCLKSTCSTSCPSTAARASSLCMRVSRPAPTKTWPVLLDKPEVTRTLTPAMVEGEPGWVRYHPPAPAWCGERLPPIGRAEEETRLNPYPLRRNVCSGAFCVPGHAKKNDHRRELHPHHQTDRSGQPTVDRAILHLLNVYSK